MLHKILHELLWLATGTVVIGIVLKLLFPVSTITTVAKLMGSVLWLFVLPGYGIMLPWQNELELKERVIVGMLAAAGLLAIASYYLGIAGMHIRMHTLLFPALIILCSGALHWYRTRRQKAY